MPKAKPTTEETTTEETTAEEPAAELFPEPEPTPEPVKITAQNPYPENGDVFMSEEAQAATNRNYKVK